jgi:pyruvate-formate lyase-activating enzyme
MEDAGFQRGSCEVVSGEGARERACKASLRRGPQGYSRLIESVHLSRPEHYLSVYQSGCNHSCLKCHSWEFSQVARGRWLSTGEIAELAWRYQGMVTVWEPRERATMWHGAELCFSCGRCLLRGERGPLCPGVLRPEQIVMSPQGFGPARNIVAFTGGDIACRSGFYAEAVRKIKQRAKDLWVLLETNGYGLIPENLDELRDSGLDSFWLDIKAYDEGVYCRLCGTTNRWILRSPEEIVKRGFVLEVLVLFIPGWVEVDQIRRIAALIAGLDKGIPFTILAFFGSYRLSGVPSPTLDQMCEAYCSAKGLGLRNVRLGNLSVFANTPEKVRDLLRRIGKEGIS